MKQACYWEQYRGTSAKDLNKQALIQEASRSGAEHNGPGSLRLFERNESRGRGQARGKVPHESRHRGVPETVVPKIVHFFQSLIRRQFFKSHAVAGDKNAGAVFAEVTVHKDFFLRVCAEEGEKLRGLFVCRRRPLVDRDANEANPQ